MHSDTPTKDSPRDQLTCRINDALLRAELIRAIRDFQGAIKDWQRPAHWWTIPSEFRGTIYNEHEDDHLPQELILRIGIDPEVAKSAILDDQELSVEERQIEEEFVTENSTWPEHALALIAEGSLDIEFTGNLLNRVDTPHKLVEAFDRILDLYKRHYEGREPSHCLDEGYNHHIDLEKLIDAQSRMTVQLFQGVMSIACRQYHAIVERAPSRVEDEHEFLQHTEINVTLLDGDQPIARLTLVAEVDTQNNPFTDGDYYNFKDSMDAQSADFAEMLIESVDMQDFDEDSIFEMLRVYEGEPSHNAFLHIHDVEFWQPSITTGLAVAMMLQATIRAVTESGTSDLMTAPMDTPLESLLKADFTKSPYKELPVEWPALCDRVVRVFILDPLRHMDEVLDSAHLSEPEKADYQDRQMAAREAYQTAGQYLDADLRERAHFYNPERTDFIGEMLRLAKHNLR